MVRIVVGGQLRKNDIADLVKKIGGEKVSVEIKADIQAANDIKLGNADYYLGACETGAGGALSMAMAILTMAKCETVSMPGRPPKKDKIVTALENGKVAFGFTASHIDEAVKLILDEII